MQGLAAIKTRYASIWPFVSWGLFVIGAIYCVASIAGLTGWQTGSEGIVAGDAWNYWSAEPYSDEHYRYSPAFYWATLPLRALPWELFLAIWTTAHLAAIVWLGPWTILLAFDDVVRGNITTFLAAALVFALRGRVWMWATVFLTKVTPGVGILYHAGKHEWRAVVVGIGVTAGVVAVGTFINADLWADWFRSLRVAADNYQTIDALAPLPVRLAVGAALCLFGARWIWLLPLGMIIAMPGLWPSSFALLAALPKLLSSEVVRAGR
jgi:hypothetical protein